MDAIMGVGDRGGRKGSTVWRSTRGVAVFRRFAPGVAALRHCVPGVAALGIEAFLSRPRDLKILKTSPNAQSLNAERLSLRNTATPNTVTPAGAARLYLPSFLGSKLPA
jgi:hypothetical protein